MKKRSMFAVLFIVLFAAALLAGGLSLAERGLQEVGGFDVPAGALRLSRNAEGILVVTFAGEDWHVPVVGTPSEND